MAGRKAIGNFSEDGTLAEGIFFGSLPLPVDYYRVPVIVMMMPLLTRIAMMTVMGACQINEHMRMIKHSGNEMKMVSFGVWNCSPSVCFSPSVWPSSWPVGRV